LGEGKLTFFFQIKKWKIHFKNEQFRFIIINVSLDCCSYGGSFVTFFRQIESFIIQPKNSQKSQFDKEISRRNRAAAVEGLAVRKFVGF